MYYTLPIVSRRRQVSHHVDWLHRATGSRDRAPSGDDVTTQRTTERTTDAVVRRSGTVWIGYGAPLAAAAVAAWAFYGPGRFDATALRLSLEVFGTGAAVGAFWTRQDGHAGLLAFAATGFAVTGLLSLSTIGPLAWLAGALCAVALVDAAHVADRQGETLGRVPWIGGVVAAVVSLASNLIL